MSEETKPSNNNNRFTEIAAIPFDIKLKQNSDALTKINGGNLLQKNAKKIENAPKNTFLHDQMLKPIPDMLPAVDLVYDKTQMIE